MSRKSLFILLPSVSHDDTSVENCQWVVALSGYFRSISGLDICQHPNNTPSMNVTQYMCKYGCNHMVYVIYTLSLNVQDIFLNILEYHHSVRKNTYVSEWLMIYCKWQYIANQCVLIMDRVCICNSHLISLFILNTVIWNPWNLKCYSWNAKPWDIVLDVSFFLIKIPEFFHHISGFNLLKPFHVEMFSNRLLTVLLIWFLFPTSLSGWVNLNFSYWLWLDKMWIKIILNLLVWWHAVLDWGNGWVL